MKTRFQNLLTRVTSNPVAGRVLGRLKIVSNSIQMIAPSFRPANKRETLKIVGAVTFTLISVGLNVLVPILFQRISKMIAPGSNTPEEDRAVNYQYQFMLTLVAHGAGWTIAQWGVGARRLLMNDISGNAIRKFNLETMRRVSQLSHADQKRIDVGEMTGAMNRASGSAMSLSQTVFTNLVPLGGEILLNCFALAKQYNSSYAFTALKVLGACATYTFCTMNLEKKEEKRWQELSQQLDSRTQHLLRNTEAISVAMTWDIELETYDDHFSKTVAADVRKNMMFEVTPGGQSLILGIAVTILLSKMSTAKFSPEDFHTLNLYMMSFCNAAINLSYAMMNFRQGITTMEKSFSMLEEKKSSLHSSARVLSQISVNPIAVLTESKLTVEFKHVDFCYEESKKILNDMSVQLRSGEMTAIMGKVGSGKSSISRLLFRFYDVNDGEILVNGRNIQHFDKTEFRKKVAIALQDTTIFPGSLYKNLTYGCTNADRQEVDRLVERIGLKDLVDELGYGTDLSNRNLSGGQKQKVGLVRTLLRKGVDIYIFDEITSALDPKSKQTVMASIQDYTQGKLVLIITHDASLVPQFCNRVLVLHEGRLEQDGAPNVLAKRPGFYRQFTMGADDAQSHKAPSSGHSATSTVVTADWEPPRAAT